MDPDIVAALDEDFDYDDPDNVLDDDFIVKANSASAAADMRSEMKLCFSFVALKLYILLYILCTSGDSFLTAYV